MSEHSKSSHPSASRLPPSPSASDVRHLADVLEEFRRSLWPLASSTPQGRAPRTASRVRATLADAIDPLHDLARAIEVHAIVALVEE